jgi:hypothetical protein
LALLDPVASSHSGRPVPVRVVHGEDLAAFVAGKRPITDAARRLLP